MRGESGGELLGRLRRQWAVVETGATVVGVLVVATFLRVFHDVGVLSEHGDEAVLVVYLAIGLPAMWVWRKRRSRAVWRWLQDDRAATGRERVRSLREPRREAAVQASFWGVAAVLFAGLMLSVSAGHAVEMALAIVLGGVTTCALTCLLVERLLRPVTARTLGVEPPEQPVGPGVRERLIMTWALASGVPLLGLVLLALRALSRGLENENPDALAVSVLILAGAGLGAGATAAVLSTRSLADPLGAVRRALGRVHAGDLDARRGGSPRPTSAPRLPTWSCRRRGSNDAHVGVGHAGRDRGVASAASTVCVGPRVFTTRAAKRHA